MPLFSACITFRGGRGHCYVTVLNSTLPIDKFEKTECHDYTVKSGTYDILFQGVSPAGGTTIIVKSDDETLGKRTVPEEGYFSRRIRITI